MQQKLVRANQDVIKAWSLPRRHKTVLIIGTGKEVSRIGTNATHKQCWAKHYRIRFDWAENEEMWTQLDSSMIKGGVPRQLSLLTVVGKVPRVGRPC